MDVMTYFGAIGAKKNINYKKRIKVFEAMSVIETQKNYVLCSTLFYDGLYGGKL